MSKVFQDDEALMRQSIAFRCFMEGKSYVHIPHEQFDSSILPRIDFLIEVNNKRVAIEVKGVKKVDSIEDKHQPIVGLRKLVDLQKYVNEYGFDYAYIVWAYEDGIKYAEIREVTGTVVWGGRKPREGSVNDAELVIKLYELPIKTKSYL